MIWKKLHYGIGLISIALFILSGLHMFMHFPVLYEANEVIRYQYRANHIYILMAGLLNLFVGLYFQYAVGKWRLRLQALGSIALLIAPAVLYMAFNLEPQQALPARSLTVMGVKLCFVGGFFHFLAMADIKILHIVLKDKDSNT